MITKVWKFELPIDDQVEVTLPFGAKIRLIDAQEEKLYVWAEFDVDEERTSTRRFRIVGTGHEINHDDVSCQRYHFKFVTSVQMVISQCRLVWHIYELTEVP